MSTTITIGARASGGTRTHDIATLRKWWNSHYPTEAMENEGIEPCSFCVQNRRAPIDTYSPSWSGESKTHASVATRSINTDCTDQSSRRDSNPRCGILVYKTRAVAAEPREQLQYYSNLPFLKSFNLLFLPER
jgi:hypothetical protein